MNFYSTSNYIAKGISWLSLLSKMIMQAELHLPSTEIAVKIEIITQAKLHKLSLYPVQVWSKDKKGIQEDKETAYTGNEVQKEMSCKSRLKGQYRFCRANIYGTEFQSLGPSTEKACPPQAVISLCTCRATQSENQVKYLQILRVSMQWRDQGCSKYRTL